VVKFTFLLSLSLGKQSPGRWGGDWVSIKTVPRCGGVEKNPDGPTWETNKQRFMLVRCKMAYKLTDSLYSTCADALRSVTYPLVHTTKTRLIYEIEHCIRNHIRSINYMAT
jgi:hypothetical protein